MTSNKEIEFKTLITKEKYEELLKKFNLENNVFSQTNFYFDTENTDLREMKTVLRIRQKGENYKLTSKCHEDGAALETHMLLTKNQALDMLKNGFNAKIINLPKLDVKNIAQLTTHRVSTVYKDGVVFFDYSEYYGHVDYEVEYEVDSIEQGKIDFESFLHEYNIEFSKSTRKSERAYSCINK